MTDGPHPDREALDITDAEHAAALALVRDQGIEYIDALRGLRSLEDDLEGPYEEFLDYVADTLAAEPLEGVERVVDDDYTDEP